MGYSLERLQQALLIFQTAKRQDRAKAASGLDQAPSHKYTFRRQHLESSHDVSICFPASDTSTDDDYDPGARQKKKANSKKGKRKAEDKPEGEVNPKKTKVLQAQDDQIRCTVFVTLKPGRDLLEKLAEQYGTELDGSATRTSASRLSWGSIGCTGDGALSRIAREREAREAARKHLSASMTYTERLDEECREIDNRNGRALRNRKVPEFETVTKKSKLVCGGSKTESVLPLTPPSNLIAEPRPTSQNSTEPVPNRHSGQSVQEIIPISPSLSDEEGEVLMIKTHFAHPIDFKCKKSPCDFCLDFRFGIAGMEQLLVEVLRLPNSEQFEEMGDGHRSRGCRPTKMCVRCSLSRLRIWRCQKHALEKIPSLTEKRLSKQFEEQKFARPGSVAKSVFPICSLCQHASSLRPATARCCKRQTTDMMGSALPFDESSQGCGLYTCRFCEKRIGADHGLIREECFGEASYEWCGPSMRRPRADLEFLFSNSLLQRAYGQATNKNQPSR